MAENPLRAALKFLWSIKIPAGKGTASLFLARPPAGVVVCLALLMVLPVWMETVAKAQGTAQTPNLILDIKIEGNFQTTEGEIFSNLSSSVGYSLASYLKDAGAKLLGSDIDTELTDRAASELGVEIVPVGEMADVECDILAPCALGAVLNKKTIPQLRCSIVAGAANNQLDKGQRDGQALHERGILYAPDFVINAGGLINVYNELAPGGYDEERALAEMEKIRTNMREIFRISNEENISTAVAANRFAERRIEAVQAQAEQGA